MTTRAMKRMSMKSIWVSLVVLVAAGCAAPEKYILGIDVPTAANPADGPPVVLMEVVDAREFLGPDAPRSQSHLHQFAAEGMGVRSEQERLYAQMRRTDGSVVYDFVLPAGESVSNVTRMALEAGFRRAGYRIVGKNSPDAAQAARIRAEIERFWAWNAGREHPFFTFEATVKLTGDVRLQTPDGSEQTERVESSVSLETMFMARPQAFVNTTSKGLDQFIDNLQAGLGR